MQLLLYPVIYVEFYLHHVLVDHFEESQSGTDSGSSACSRASPTDKKCLIMGVLYPLHLLVILQVFNGWFTRAALFLSYNIYIIIRLQFNLELFLLTLILHCCITAQVSLQEHNKRYYIQKYYRTKRSKVE